MQILLIEDSPSAASAIALRLQQNLAVQVVCCGTYADAKQLLASNGSSFFVAVTGLELPDAPRGEIVDLMRAHGLGTIVLTGRHTQAADGCILAEGVLDYIYKGAGAMDNLVELLGWLLANHGSKVLVVEDSPSAMAELRGQLERRMLQVVEARDGRSALAQVKSDPELALAVVDYVLPDMTGDDLTRAMRRHRSKDDLAIIGISAVTDRHLSSRFIKSGANDFLHKPFGLEELDCRVVHNLERLKHVAQIREHGERLKAIVDTVNAGIVIIDPETSSIVDVNHFASQLIGLAPDDIVGKACHEFICPAQSGECPITDKGQAVDHSERKLLTCNGNSLDILKTVSPIFLNDRVHLLETFFDISDRKALERLREDVERIMRHDLRGPLNGIIGLPELIAMEGNLSEDQVELLDCIKASGEQMLRMIDLSLDLYKMEQGTYTLVPQELDLADVLRRVCKDAGGRAEAHGVALYLEEGAESWVLGEDLLVYSVVSNLVNNAVEASPAGAAVTIRATLEESAVVSVHNQGCVPAEIRGNLFEKYVTSGKAGGTGLGTYSAKLIAETLGGEIAYTTDEVSGTVFTVSIPAVRGEPARMEPLLAMRGFAPESSQPQAF